MTISTLQVARHYPLSAVTAAFGAGALMGWLIARDMKTRLYARGEQRHWKARDGKAYQRAISRWEGEGGAIPPSKKGSKK